MPERKQLKSRSPRKKAARKKSAAKKSASKSKLAGAYFIEPECSFFTSGCTLLDMALGGGGVENRITNLVGDKSSGKTLQAIEFAANYRHKYPQAEIHYAETEQAFDPGYAQSVGLPADGVHFPEMFTVEELFNDLERVIAKGERALYIVDSLDALSDSAEMDTKLTDGTYGTSKAKMLSRMFRQLNQKLSKGNVTVIIVSQIRDNIGAMYGKKTKRSGGKALDFYCSHVIYLTHIKRLEMTRKGVKRPYGVLVQAMVEKNKVGMPFRKAQYPIYFAFGVEDVVAGITWLLEVKRHSELWSSQDKAKKFLKSLNSLDDREYRRWRKRINATVRKVWREIEMEFLPARQKYRG